jgi:hypothetical protein
MGTKSQAYRPPDLTKNPKWQPANAQKDLEWRKQISSGLRNTEQSEGKGY